LIAARGWTRIGEAEWNDLAAAMPTLATADLNNAGVPVDAPWSGVEQKTLDNLERSLCALTEVYGSRPELRRFCRREVIRAKDRARRAARNARVSEEKRALKAEMVEWMLVWLGDPAIFPGWARVRGTHLNGPA
jgi:hypothetical protein